MNSTDKYLQRRKFISDENLCSLWERLIQDQSDESGIPRLMKIESLPEQKERNSDSNDDFIEVWLSIEESILNFESELVKKKEKLSYNHRSKTNLNF